MQRQTQAKEREEEEDEKSRERKMAVTDQIKRNGNAVVQWGELQK